MQFLPLEKTMNFRDVIILIEPDFNKIKQLQL